MECPRCKISFTHRCQRVIVSDPGDLRLEKYIPNDIINIVRSYERSIKILKFCSSFCSILYISKHKLEVLPYVSLRIKCYECKNLITTTVDTSFDPQTNVGKNF